MKKNEFVALLAWSLLVVGSLCLMVYCMRPEALVKREIVVESEVVYVPSVINAELLGDFEVTYYTAGHESTGKRPGEEGYGITKSGATVTKDLTIAVDPKVIPLGTYVYIEGVGIRVAQDIGGAIKGNKVDIYVSELKDALERGRHHAKVYILEGGYRVE